MYGWEIGAPVEAFRDVLPGLRAESGAESAISKHSERTSHRLQTDLALRSERRCGSKNSSGSYSWQRASSCQDTAGIVGSAEDPTNSPYGLFWGRDNLPTARKKPVPHSKLTRHPSAR